MPKLGFKFDQPISKLFFPLVESEYTCGRYSDRLDSIKAQCSPQPLTVMPDPTDCQLATDALHQAFLVNLIAEAEALAYQDGSDSDDGSDKNIV